MIRTCIVIWAMMLLAFQGIAQICCSSTSTPTNMFAANGNNQNFIAAHANPNPYSGEPHKGKMITLEIGDGKHANAYMVNASQKSTKYLVVFHEWWGLNDYIKEQCDNYAMQRDGINIIALDFYDGSVATNSENAAKLMGEAKDDYCRKIIQAVITMGGPSGQYMTVGWCFGGGWSLQAAIMMGPMCKGCIMYYGMPETDSTKISKISFPVLGLFASQDEWITPEVVKQFKQNMNAGNKLLEVYNFDAPHAFANPSNPQYNVAYAQQCNKYVQQFIAKYFR